MSGFGISAWGTGPWGLAAPVSFSLESVVANSERTLLVTFSAAALVGTPLTPGAALNLSSWAVTASEHYLLAIREIEGSAATQFELYFLKPFPRYPALITCDASAVLAADGVTALATVTSLQCEGAAPSRTEAQRNKSLTTDIRSLPLSDDITGVLNITAGGDYETEEGEALLKKIILRRILTKRGAFKHLAATNFGLGLSPKQTVRTSGLVQLRDDIEAQVRQEPEVSDVQVRVSYSPATEVLQINISVVWSRTGSQADMGLSLNPNGSVKYTGV